MSQLRLEINLDNATFEGDELGIELSRILRAVSNRYYDMSRQEIADDATEYKLKDINGNTVGSVWINIEDDDENEDDELRPIYERILAQSPERAHLARFLEEHLGMGIYVTEAEGTLLEALAENIRDGSTDIEEFEAFMFSLN